MLSVIASENKCIKLGKRGENSARVITFDITLWVEKLGIGEVLLVAKRNGDMYPYSVQVTRESNQVSWVVTSIDVDSPGYGECELIYIVDNKVVKSIIYQTFTEDSLADPVLLPSNPNTYASVLQRIGDLNSLSTDYKTDVVGAINEIYSKMGEPTSVVVDPTLTLEGYAADSKAVGDAFTKLKSNKVLGFYCVEDVEVVTNGVSKTYPANSFVELLFSEDDVFEIVPTSDNSIQTLTSFPGALSTFYPWLEGVKQFSNILFDMNDEDMYTKWSQGNQGAYQVQYAQYTNCIFWSDNPYISDVAKRTNYTIYYSAQLPLCYSTIPDNTFKAFYLAFGANSDPNWGNQVYRDSFAKATWATQVFSYYGARTIGVFGHDDPDFNITLPKDCRGLMCEATAIENAGTFDAINTTNFGAKQGSWRDAFRMCSSLRNLYIKNLKVSLNVSWSPLNYESISFIISKAANTSKITISVSPYTYNLLSQSDFELATSKNITIELLTANYVEDRRLSDIANKVDKAYVEQYIEKYLADNFQSLLLANLPTYEGEG